MKKNYIVKMLFVICIATAVLASCGNNKNDNHAAHQHNQLVQEYTCPMHTQIVEEVSGDCPICGVELVLRNNHNGQDKADTSITYLLQPVNQSVVATIPVISPRQEAKTYKAEAQGRIDYDTRNQKTIASNVSGRIERLFIRYNYQPVKRGQLILEVYSPELASAQRELLFIKKTGNEEGMLEGAKQRLRLLGMETGQINRVLNTGKISYRIPIYSNANGFIVEQTLNAAAINPEPGSKPVLSSGSGMNEMGSNNSSGSSNIPSNTVSPSSPILIREGGYVTAGQSLFTIYQPNSIVAEFSLPPEIVSRVGKKSTLKVKRTGSKTESFNGTIGLIQPIFSRGENFTIARVYLKNTNLRVGELVTAIIPISLKKGWWVPNKAIVSLGNKTVVFKAEGRVFVPKSVLTGPTANGEVQIMGDIGDWKIAASASYLVDSESFIKINPTKEK